VCAAGADVEWLVDALVTGVAELCAGGVADTDDAAGRALRFAWFATATVLAMPKNDAMLSPPSSQRVAAAGCRRRACLARATRGGVAPLSARLTVVVSLASRGAAVLRVEAARRSWSRRIRAAWSELGVSVIVGSDLGAGVLSNER
jgi:hypothetical protein